ncbi:MAG: hypothetical protein M3Q37_00685 [Gemmatimonadota bacterium]|nr:hypothetical protein [Gemmatimonadota bacterium]
MDVKTGGGEEWERALSSGRWRCEPGEIMGARDVGAELGAIASEPASTPKRPDA